MKRIQLKLGLGLGVAAAVALFITGGFGTGPQALAQNPTISMNTVTLGPGAETTLDLQASDIAQPGIGAWLIDVVFDPSVVTALGCVSISGSRCNASFGDDRVRSVGANANGLAGNTVLASIRFRCKRAPAGTALIIAIEELSDATVGSPQPLDVTVHHGGIACTPPEPSPTPTPAQQSLRGDVDCSGHVDSRDAEVLLQYLALLTNSLPCRQNADVSRDSHIDAVDATLILQMDAHLI